MNRRLGRRIDGSYVVSVLTLFSFALIGITPIFWMLLTSLKQQIDVFAWPPKMVFTPTLDHYRVVLLGSNFLGYLRNSVMVAILASSTSLVLGSMCAYSISRFNFRGRRLLLFWILFTRLIPPLCLMIPLFLMMRQLGLYDTVPGLALVHTTFNLPMTVWLMATYFDDIPRSLEEAALIDGCSRWGVLLRVILPLSRPGLVATSILNVVFSWNEFPFALMLTTRTAKTLPVSITEWLVERGLLWGEMSAAGFLIIVPVLVFAVLVQRHLVRGLTMGAIKG